jgi:hypothetical protein
MKVITSASVAKAKNFVEELRRLGFVPGAPARVPADWLEIDRRMAKAMRCGGCGRRGLRLDPFHRGHEYQAVVSCIRCGFGEEA